MEEENKSGEGNRREGGGGGKESEEARGFDNCLENVEGRGGAGVKEKGKISKEGGRDGHGSGEGEARNDAAEVGEKKEREERGGSINTCLRLLTSVSNI